MLKSLMTATTLALTLASSTLASQIKIVQNDALNALSPTAQDRLVSAIRAASTRRINAFNSGNAGMATAQ